MTVSELSVRRPVLMTMVYLLIMVIAIVYLPRLDIALYPDIDMPVISVMVECGEAGPEEIEQQVARTLENRLSSVENLNKMTSRSQDGRCFIILEFEYGTDLDEAKDDVENAVSLASYSLPDWVEGSQVIEMNAIMSSTIMRLTLSGPLSLSELQSLADDTVAPLLERVSGVSEVDSIGGAEKEYNVLVSLNRADAYGLTLSEISSAISKRNIQATAGEITEDGIDYQITIDERYTSIEDIENTLLKTVDGYDVILSDIASVVEGVQDGASESYYNGSEVITLSISNTSDSNETTVAKAVLAALPSIREILPEGVTLEVQQDSTEMIVSTMGEVASSLIEGVLLAALIIFIFLRGIKPTIIISLSMPISVLITLMIMSITGMSVNMMTMSGLILGIGMIVDASIIILENTYSFRQQGEKSAIAAILGSKNMFLSITASTLTTVCVFLPFIIYKYDLEMMGIMFQDLIITVCISLLCSLFVSVTLVPALCGSILKINTRVQKPLRFKVLRVIDDLMAKGEEKMRNAYARILSFFLDHRMLLIVLLILLLAFSLTEFDGIGLSLTPANESDDEISLSLTLPSGTTQKVTREHMFKMEETIKNIVPSDAYEGIMVEVGSSNTGGITIYLPDITEQSMSVNDIENLIRPYTAEDPDETWLFSSGQQMGSTSAIDIAIHSESTEVAESVASDIVRILNTYVPVLEDIDNDLENGQPEIAIRVNYKAARDLAVPVENISSALEAAIDGIKATELTTFSNESTYDVVVKLQDSDANEIEKLSSILVSTSNGSYVRLEQVALLEESTAPQTITREDKIRVNHITANVQSGVSVSTAQEMVNEALEQYLVIPDGIEISQEGEMSDFSSYGTALIMIVILALFLVYAVMAAQFESLMDPLIIFATIPLLLIGVIWVHVFYGADFTLFSIVGIVALIGVVVNNGIVLIDCINRLVRQKVPVREACLEAARGRLRPILMTTLTTILGLIPLAFFPGEGAEMIQPIALTFVGGITTGAFLTLLLSPVLYSILNTRREKKYDDPESLNNQLLEYDLRKLKSVDDML